MLLQRQDDRAGTSPPARTLDAHVSPVGAHDLPADRQSESTPPTLLRACSVDPIEAFKDVGQVFRGNTWAGIADADAHAAVLRVTNNSDPSVRWRIAQGIVE